MLNEVGVRVVGIVHHGLDMDDREVEPSFLNSIKEKLDDKLVTLTIASNDPRKGLDRLLQAYKIVEDKIPDSFQILHSESKNYYCYKEREFRERYYELPESIYKLGIERIWLTNRYGLMTNEEINALYRLCDIYVLSSFSEGFGLPMLEAFKFNKPVIAVNAPPFNEIIEDGLTGRLIPYKEEQWFNHKGEMLFKMHIYEPEKLAEAIVNLLYDSDLREKMENQIQEKKIIGAFTISIRSSSIFSE